MKFTTVFTFLTLSAASVYAAHYETNASRFARGLPPLPPVRRTSTWSAKRSHVSSTPGQPRSCNTGSLHCCDSVSNAGDAQTTSVTSLLGIVAPASGIVGLNCSPLSVIGAGGNSCTSQAVCCDDNHFNGLITTGCTPFNLNA